jgi:hypothetical protein
VRIGEPGKDRCEAPARANPCRTEAFSPGFGAGFRRQGQAKVLPVGPIETSGGPSAAAARSSSVASTRPPRWSMRIEVSKSVLTGRERPVGRWLFSHERSVAKTPCSVHRQGIRQSRESLPTRRRRRVQYRGHGRESLGLLRTEHTSSISPDQQPGFAARQ